MVTGMASVKECTDFSAMVVVVYANFGDQTAQGVIADIIVSYTYYGTLSNGQKLLGDVLPYSVSSFEWIVTTSSYNCPDEAWVTFTWS